MRHCDKALLLLMVAVLAYGVREIVFKQPRLHSLQSEANGRMWLAQPKYRQPLDELKRKFEKAAYGGDKLGYRSVLPERNRVVAQVRTDLVIAGCEFVIFTRGWYVYHSGDGSVTGVSTPDPRILITDMPSIYTYTR